MKSSKLILTFITGAILFLALTSGSQEIQNGNGTAASTGAPGELHTCSQAGCHGSGNGNGTSGGLLDNAGPGNITFSSIPAMTGNTYSPGITYSMIITVSEAGKSSFGFDAEILDNSGNTNLTVNNTIGTITITNPTKTHLVQAFGTGRATVTHSLNAGLSNNTATFGFNWKAPASGTVNLWASGTACNNDNLANANDNVYTTHVIVTPYVATVTSVNELTDENSFILFPNPAKDDFSISFKNQQGSGTAIYITDMDGKIVKYFADESPGSVYKPSYDISDLPTGIYFARIKCGNKLFSKKITVIK